MRLRTRIFICYFLIFVACFYYPINWMLDNLRPRYLEGVEDPLVDQANILAEMAGTEIEAGLFDSERLFVAFEKAYARTLSARIYNFEKTRTDMRIYMTDAVGKIIFDSQDKGLLGQDYAKWRDVRLTLAGEYGARTTKLDPADESSSVLYVAAPVMVYGELYGVLTVAKPTTNINSFLKDAKPKIFKVALLSVAAALLLSFLVSLWITRPIKRLTQYAHEVRENKKSILPKLDKSEIGEMGVAFEKMREALEGKNYVEQYVQTFTHEIKSPLSAIRGAAELLNENMGPEQRSLFINNIRNEAGRIQDIVDRMLELAALENQKMPAKKEKIAFHALVKTVLESKQPLIAKKELRVEDQVPDELIVEGDPFLFHQAVANLIQNAVDFSPAQGRIELCADTDAKKFRFLVRDFGPGIPDYALTKIFDKFFSLQRPDTGKKSTGLGLNLVKEVASLHHGEIELINCPDGGAQAVLTLPE
ncbi:MAG: two-component system sensor histidine kinase CreC [Desulfobacteraceae bacterium]|nr:MAG: two-component system sensor histidine kinase CreC [Desulfobacteraceae bacterium]